MASSAVSRRCDMRFLGWSRPLLHATRDYLRDRYARDGVWDMSQAVVVLPGSLAARRLSELLAEHAEDHVLLLRPPAIETVGHLPEKLYQVRLPFAAHSLQVLCWSRALQKVPTVDLQPLLIDPSRHFETSDWTSLAQQLASLHRELAADLLDFKDVADELQGTVEEPRWRVLQRLQRLYLDELGRLGYWDIQTARQVAIKRREPNTDLDIIVVGAVDLNRTQRSFLDAVSQQVTVLVGAPESWRDGFDEHGALLPSFWLDLEVHIDDDQIHVCGTTEEAAEQVAVCLAKMGASRSTQDITLGVPDPELIPVLRERLARSGVELRFGPGAPLNQSSPVRMLEGIVEYLQGGSMDSLASLIRSPIIYDQLLSHRELAKELLKKFDAYRSRTLIRSTHIPEWPEEAGLDAVQDITQRIDEWTQPLRLPKATLATWSTKIRETLQNIFDGVTLVLDSGDDIPLWEGLQQLNLAAETLIDIPAEMQMETDLQGAVDWLLHELGQARAAPLPNPDAIEMFGWLDLALDDADALILTGLTEGVVPASVNSDAFLPDTLRTKLGLIDNDRRYARDCYTLQTLVHVRPQVEIVVHQFGTTGDPVAPSRLLLAVRPEKLADRVLRLVRSVDRLQAPKVRKNWIPRWGQSLIPIPIPEPGTRVEHLSPSDFRSYLECPYRYFLSKILKLKAEVDPPTEMDAGTFGNLIHDTVALLFGSPVSNSDRSDAIAEFLLDHFADRVRAQFGVSLAPAVQLQVEQARARLMAFAEKQAQQAAAGWEIVAVEAEVGVESGISFNVDGEPLSLVGRIDRVDFHSVQRRWAIWDYKTGDSAKDPVAAHINKHGWKDLQLPLYRHMVFGVTGLRIDCNPNDMQLGYITLPKATKDAEFAVAGFTPSQLAEADEVAMNVVRKIRSGEYWPPNVDMRVEWDEYASICQSRVARRWEPELINPAQQDRESDSQVGSFAQQHPSNSSTSSSQALKEANATVLAPDAHFRLESQHRRKVEGPIRIQTKSPDIGKAPMQEWFSPLVIRASAGTGKTYQLAMRMIRLLFANQPLDHVLATTFTRKAAGEILNRVLGFLAEAIVNKDRFEQLQTELRPLSLTKEACQYQLARLCSRLHRFRVSTLDAFYQQLARAFSIELDLPAGWSIADPLRETELRDQAIEAMFDQLDLGKIRTLLGMLFKGEASRSIQSQIRDTVTNGYNFYLNSDAEAWKTLTIPRGPSDADVQEAIGRIESLAKEDGHDRIVKAALKVAEGITQQQWLDVLKQTIVKNSNLNEFKFGQKVVSRAIADDIVILRDKAVREEMILRDAQTQATYHILDEFHKCYEQVKRAAGVLTFADVAWRLANWVERTTGDVAQTKALQQKKSAQNEPSSSAKSNNFDGKALIDRADWRLDARIDHLLLDEFQDTAPEQWKIIKPFAEAIVRERERRQTSFFCVGDTKQAIYGWRGGVAEIFDEVVRQIAGVQESPLHKSRRSSPVVIEFVNRVFQNLQRHDNFGDGRQAIDIWTASFLEHETAEDHPGYVVFKNGPQASGSTATADGDDEEHESTSIFAMCVDDIERLVQATAEVSIGVLVRRNQDVASMIHLLRERRIDASQEGGNPLTDSAAVEVLLSLLAFADHPSNSVAEFHVRSSGLADQLGLALNASLGPLAMEVRRRLDRSGFGPTLSYYANAMAPLCNERDQQRLEQLIQQGYLFDSNRWTRIGEFVAYIQEKRIATPTPSQVRVMTIHQSKGLEFDAVFLPTLTQSQSRFTANLVARGRDRIQKPDGVARYMSKELWPYLEGSWREAYTLNAEHELMESTCLFYVALTRARNALYMYGEPHVKPKRPWSSVLASILDPEREFCAQSLAVIYESGDRTWYRSASIRPSTGRATAERRDLADVANALSDRAIEIQLRPGSESRRQRLMPTRRPSSEHEARKVLAAAALSPAQSIGQIVGTIVHCLFEQVDWLEDFQWDREAMKQRVFATLPPEDLARVSVAHCLDSMERWIAHDTIRAALSRSRYEKWIQSGVTKLEVYNERALLEVMERTLVRGTIDRLVLGYQGDRIARVEILDYKTDAMDPNQSPEAWLEERTEYHRPQLELYRDVLCKQFGLSKARVALTLIMLSKECLVSIESNSGESSSAESIPSTRKKNRSKDQHSLLD